MLHEEVGSQAEGACGDMLVLPIYAALPPELQVCLLSLLVPPHAISLHHDPAMLRLSCTVEQRASSLCVVSAINAVCYVSCPAFMLQTGIQSLLRPFYFSVPRKHILS